MSFAGNALGSPRPEEFGRQVRLPRRKTYFASPLDWRDEVLYFLLVDRFSDAREGGRPLLDRSDLWAARPGGAHGWRWDRWAESGSDRFQGGTLAGVRSKLHYLKNLGVTTLWLSPVFKQRGHQDSYHGYGIQDFLDVDPRFGSRADLVALVAEAHEMGLRVILDVIFNHSGCNWVYPEDTPGGPWTPHYSAGRYPFGAWLDREGKPIPAPATSEDGVWPREFQDPEVYTRSGSGALGAGDLNDPFAEHKRTDFITLRDFDLSRRETLGILAGVYKYWIALTDCDGFRIDTLKHVSLEEARNFCGAVKEFAASLGKNDFLLVGEIAGGDAAQDRYLDVLERNLNAALDIGEMRQALGGVAKGLVHPSAFFGLFNPGDAAMGSHRNLGQKHVAILDDHDHVFGEKIRFSAEAASPEQVSAGLALQLFSLGIPCVYYGTEQSLGGPEPSARPWLPSWKSSDRYLREALFGPEHPRAAGRAGLTDGSVDTDLPGFGPFGTSGRHVFDDTSPVYRHLSKMAAVRRRFPALRQGRQYARPISFLGLPLDFYGPGEIVAWSRILDDEELLCVINSHGAAPRGGRILVDASLNPHGSAFTVVLDTASEDVPPPIPVERDARGAAFIVLPDLPPSAVRVLANHPAPEEGGVVP